ncbi:MAG: glutamyl-tRNA reductase [Planctomycetota bacterium]|jgi:glutamyl-tRNA reductase
MEDLRLCLVGLSHRTADLEVRELCAVPASELTRRLRALTALSGVQEAWILSTCNRTEVLVALSRGTDELRERVLAAVDDLVFRAAAEEALYHYEGVETVLHLFRVSSGLDSLVLGESQILSQIKEATRAAREAHCLGKTLEALLRHSQVTGKRVRNETTLGEGTVSVARVGVDVARHVVGRYGDARLLIIGAGETGQLVARNLQAEGARSITFANRSKGRAEEAASKFDASARGLEDLPELLAASDVVFACVDGAPSLVEYEHLNKRVLAQRDRPLVLVDLSVPRAIDSNCAEFKQVIVYDLDDLTRIVERNQASRQKAVQGAGPILLSEAQKFLGLRSYHALTPLVKRLRERYDEVRESELDVVAGAKASPEMIQLAHRLTKHLLDVALDELKSNARDTVPTESIDMALQRFLDREGEA